MLKIVLDAALENSVHKMFVLFVSVFYNTGHWYKFLRVLYLSTMKLYVIRDVNFVIFVIKVQKITKCRLLTVKLMKLDLEL